MNGFSQDGGFSYFEGASGAFTQAGIHTATQDNYLQFSDFTQVRKAIWCGQWWRLAWGCGLSGAEGTRVAKRLMAAGVQSESFDVLC